MACIGAFFFPFSVDSGKSQCLLCPASEAWNLAFRIGKRHFILLGRRTRPEESASKGSSGVLEASSKRGDALVLTDRTR